MRLQILIGAILITASAAFAQSERATEIGRIESVSANFDPNVEDAYVLRAGHKIVPRAHVIFLRPNDKIYVLAHQMDIAYSVVGSDELRHVTRESSPVNLPNQGDLRPSFCTLINCDFIMRLRQEATWSPIIVYTRSHAGLEPVMPARFLPAGEQVLPQDAEQIAVIWSGGTGIARVNQERGARSEASFQILSRPSVNSFNLTLSGDSGSQLVWPVRIVNIAPPAPPGFDANGAPSEFDRLERALYLLQPFSGRDTWHLFAISELAALRRTSITADLAWRQVVTGTYQPKS